MSETEQTQPRILVVDDDQSIRQLVRTIMQREQFSVDTAADGLEAVEKLKQHTYSVILLDLMMPRLDGFGVISFIKGHPQLAKPIILIMTAYANQKFKEVDTSIVAGVLHKPFDVSEVGSLVRLCVSGVEQELKRVAERSKGFTMHETFTADQNRDDSQN